MTWLTESASTPITVRSPERFTSTTTMHVRLVIAISGSPSFTARSTTGTTLPRRLMTPRMLGGVVGTFVTTSYSRISRTRRMPIAYSSPATWKPRYWPCSATVDWLAIIPS